MEPLQCSARSTLSRRRCDKKKIDYPDPAIEKLMKFKIIKLMNFEIIELICIEIIELIKFEILKIFEANSENVFNNFEKQSKHQH